MLALADPADLDDGPRTNRSGTERMCVVTRQVWPIDDLIRFVVGPTGEVVPDLKRKLFGRGFKREVQVSPTLAEDTERLLVRGTVEALAMAAKAGHVVSGFSKVEGAIDQRQVVALIHASDGAIDGIRKLDARLD